MLVCVSQGWPPRKSWTNRTPRSTSRRAIRQRVPYSRVCVLVQSVERFDVSGLVRDVERLLGGRLHGGGELVAANPGFEVGLAGMAFEVPSIEPVEECEILALGLASKMGRRVEIQDPRLLRPEHGALIHRRHEPARPVVRAVDRMSLGVGEDHVGRELF